MRNKIIEDIMRLGTPEKARLAARFFKMKKGEYGEGDKFLGVSVPLIRKIIRPYYGIELLQIKELLLNPWHEIRLAGCLLLVHKYQKSFSKNEKKKIVNFYLKYREGINNWDLVDQTAYKIIGDFCLTSGEIEILTKMIKSQYHWDRRIAMVATLAFIRKNKFNLVINFSKKIFKDKEDLMHKASGWMLREMGKRDHDKLLKFIQQHGSSMPRTMLRYAIEKFPQEQKRLILIKSRNKKA